MNNELRTFTDEQFGNVRTLLEGDTVLFCGTDVAKALGYSNVPDTLNRHCKGIVKRDTLTAGGVQEMSFIPEGDVYRLIARSKLPAAQRFEAWLFEEVLPSIRKTGGYVANDELFIDTYMPFADESTKALFRLQLQNTRELNSKIKEQKAQLAEAEPKVEYYDRLIDQGDTLSIRDTAKAVGLTERTLVYFLMGKNMLYRDKKNRLRPYAEHCPRHFVLKEFINEKNGYASVQTRVTVEGREKIMKLLKKDSEVKAQ